MLNFIRFKKRQVGNTREKQFSQMLIKLGFERKNENCWSRGNNYFNNKVFIYFRYTDCVVVSAWHPHKEMCCKTPEELKVFIKEKFKL
jgi:hypothetical protein